MSIAQNFGHIGCHVQRTLDASLTRWILQRQSVRALGNLKAVIERLD